MTEAPEVLGLALAEAEKRLSDHGFSVVAVCETGRRREGRPRVVRQKFIGGQMELVISYFKELNSEKEDISGSGCLSR